jgi:predicted dehydrogenase
MALQTPVKIAVIGGSGYIGKRHCEHIAKNSPITQLVAIVDPSEAAVAVAARYKVRLYRTVDELLSSPDMPHGSIVCTPNHTHVPICKQLASGGVKAILCEKPISTTIASARSLMERAEEHRVKLLVGHHRRFNPWVIACKDVVDSGVLGDITAVSGLWMSSKPAAYFEGPLSWRGNKSQGGGVVLNNFIHEIDLMHHLFGPVVRIHAEKTISRRAPNAMDAAEEGAAVTLRFESGVVGTFIMSDNVSSPHSFEQGTGENPNLPRTGLDVYRIFGTKGTLSFPDMTLSTYEGDASWEKEMVIKKVMVKDRQVAPFDSQLKHFAAVCRGEEEPNCSGEHGLRALVVCEAIRKAIDGEDGGATIRIDEM